MTSDIPQINYCFGDLKFLDSCAEAVSKDIDSIIEQKGIDKNKVVVIFGEEYNQDAQHMLQQSVIDQQKGKINFFSELLPEYADQMRQRVVTGDPNLTATKISYYTKLYNSRMDAALLANPDVNYFGIDLPITYNNDGNSYITSPVAEEVKDFMHIHPICKNFCQKIPGYSRKSVMILKILMKASFKER